MAQTQPDLGLAGRPARFSSASTDSRGGIVDVGSLFGEPVNRLFVTRYSTEPTPG